jgi:hypothetical protein
MERFLVIITHMEAFFPDLDTERFPPETVRLLELTAELLPDGRRIQTHLSLTPFIKPPLIELVLTDPEGETCGGASVVEPASWKLDLILHLRTPELKAGCHSLTAVLSYPGMGEIDQRKVEYNIPTV